ncbi:MAG: anthranilate synthase component I family protein [Opitutae bacterium]|nr:anthranilate synthase component I family protein [Opitutae bacterium]
MTGSTQTTSIGSLSNLGACPLAIRAEPGGGYLVYLDFTDLFEPDCRQLEETFRNLARKEPSDKLGSPGWIGFFGYEFLAAHLGLSLRANRDLTIPDGWFGRPKTIIHLLPEATRVESEIPGRIREISGLLEKEAPAKPSPIPGAKQPIACNLGFEEYSNVFKQAREAILDGETYQIKISQRFEAQAEIDPILAFERLCLANPAPEAFLLLTENFSILSCSPETVIERKEDRMTTRPIGGTYERKTPSSDGSVIESFLKDPKEVAEHNMLVDLERNDLSAICKPGTVAIDRFREVESYAHLHHLVSTIRGSLKEGIDLPTLLKSMLPGGSITGCPKIRTMEWIDRLEPCFRGPYTGSFGSISDNGDLRLNLIIRSMLVTNDRCYAQAGGGIVVESTPEYEYNENKIKAQALLDLLA